MLRGARVGDITKRLLAPSATDRGRARRDGNDDIFVARIFSLTGGYRFTPHWQLRASWHRTITDYDRDADVLLGGIGYRL